MTIKGEQRKPFRKPTNKEVALMREMYLAGVWENYKVTCKVLGEWFFISEKYANSIVSNEIRVLRERKKSATL